MQSVRFRWGGDRRDLLGAVLEFFVAVRHPVDFEGEVDVILELGGNPRVIDIATRNKEVQRGTLGHT